jgi:SagB-type dehydrogenase family enzyme
MSRTSYCCPHSTRPVAFPVRLFDFLFDPFCKLCGAKAHCTLDVEARDQSSLGHLVDVLLDPPGAQLNQLYLMVHAVEGLDSGAYVFHRSRGLLECLKKGNFRAQAGYLGLEQELPADAAVDIFFLADLEPILQRFGNRGYRAVQLEAGILGGKLYLGAYAQQLGATGLTFYDDDVIRFFSPHAEGKSTIFLVAVGKSSRQKPE